MLGYNFVKSNIGHDGIGYMCFDLEPEKLDEHDLINGVRAVDVTHDHKKQQTTTQQRVFTFKSRSVLTAQLILTGDS